VIAIYAHEERIINPIKAIGCTDGEFDHAAIESVIPTSETIVVVQPYDPSNDGSVDSGARAGKSRSGLSIVLPLDGTAPTVIVDLKDR
jgi:hypothetical protein